MDRLAALLDFHRADPTDAFTRFALAQEYRKRGDTDTALGYFQALLHDDPDYVGTYYHLGKLYEALGRADEAVATYRTGIAATNRVGDAHARSELQGALLAAEGLGFDD